MLSESLPAATIEPCLVVVAMSDVAVHLKQAALLAVERQLPYRACAIPIANPFKWFQDERGCRSQA